MDLKNKILNRIFCDVLYVGDEQYIISQDGTVQEKDSESAPNYRVVIAGKSHYFETVRSFPFGGTKDIRSAVSMDIASFSPFETDLFFLRKNRSKDGHSEVNLWFMKPESADLMNKISPFIIIPETALFSSCAEDVPALFSVHNKKGGQNTFIHIDRYRNVKSVVSENDRPSLFTFRRAAVQGRQCDDTGIVDSMGSWMKVLHEMLFKMPLQHFLPFINGNKIKVGEDFDKPQLKLAAVSFVSIFVIYTAISLFLPWHALSNLKERDAALTKDLSELLGKQDKITLYRNRENVLAREINRYNYKFPVFIFLDDIIPEGTELKTFICSGSEVEINGIAPQASELLSVISENRNIGNARFTRPLRKDSRSGKEVFTLAFSFNGGELLTSKGDK